ncbi:MAG TPA: protein kinase [Thermoanaerobaculia bacterium]|nr:protein kinase [Thermoanaerobaculia bacterium]
MSRVVAIGQPANDSEREAIAYLRDHLPNSCVVIHNFELKQGQELYEIDIALLTPYSVYVVDVKGTRGLIDVYGTKWYPEGRAPYHSPLAILRKHAKALKTFICDQHPADTTLRGVYVDAAVLMTAPDAHVQDAGGQDGPSVAYLTKCASFFQDKRRVPSGFSTDIRPHLGQVEKAIVGRAKPKSAPLCYGNWQVEEKLGGTDRYTEYRARHTLLGARRGGTARLRIYQVDAYLPDAERQGQVKLISNAFRSLANLPGHPNILSVREFFDDEDARNWFALVTEDVAGQALRQHIKKSGLALTFDQKIGVIRDVLSALDHAHRSDPQVIHRNLTPDAILVSSSGRALLCGFDYARAGKDRTSTIAEEIIDELEPLYQAPECYRDPAKASVASDLFAAGLVFFELLVGEPPWSSIDDMLEKDGVFAVKPSEAKPDLAAGLDQWLQSLCAFDVEDRPTSAAVALVRFNEIVGPDPREAAKSKKDGVAPSPARPEIDYQVLVRGDEVADRFRIEERLGSGGFAVAYKVFDSFSDTTRVLKIVVKDRRSTFQRLKQEYRVLERLKPHPNVVRVVWADKLPDETPFIVFEYVPGTGVGELLDAGALSLEDVKRIGEDTLAGLEHLHASGVFHRDIKPSNLLWTDQGVRIIDFNVAVHEDDTEARAGGTRRYIPPDLELGEALTRDEEVDRDLYALGITLYECATGKYPWTEVTPPLKIPPRDPQTYISDLSSEFVQVIVRAIAPRRGDRFSSASEFRSALARVTNVRVVPAQPPFETTPGTDTTPALSLLQPHKPNFNPFVSHLLTMYSQSTRSNAGTRGLDAVGRETYVKTLLDEKLRPAVLAGRFSLVIVTGNAGDGKTAFVQQIERKASLDPDRRANGSAFVANGRRFLTNYDGSQDEENKGNDDVLQEFLKPFEGRDAARWAGDETRIIAINEGRLVDFLTEHQNRFSHLRRLVLAGLTGASPSDGVVTVNLNLRAVVANPHNASPAADSIFDRLLRRFTHDQFWAACASCDIRDRCYVHHNARTLMDPVAGAKVGERLRSLYAITHLRGRLHITMRDLRSALAFTIAGTRDCDEIHALYETPGADARRQILEGFYFNSWRGGEGSADRLLSLLREVDVGEATNPDLDRALDYLPPSAREMARFTFAQRGERDSELLDSMYRELPRDSAVSSAPRRVTDHRSYVAMLRRRQFFERRDDGWKEMLPYRTADEFWRLMIGQSEAGNYVNDLITAINRGEGLSDPDRLGNALALRVRVVEKGTIRSYRLFPGERFRLVLPATGNNEFVEHIPQALRLVYSGPSRHEAELLVGLDIYEMLARLNDGYRPSLEELQGYYLSLAVFKNVLASAPYQEVLLTRTGHDFYRVRRESAGTLYLEALGGGVS